MDEVDGYYGDEWDERVMSISFGDLARDERSITVKLKDGGLDGEEVNVCYRPSAYTPEHESRVAKMFSENLPAGALAESLAGVVVSWDVLGEDGKAMGVTLGELNRTPSWFLVVLSDAIGDDMRVKREEIKNLGGGSRAAASKGRSRSGTR